MQVYQLRNFFYLFLLVGLIYSCGGDDVVEQSDVKEATVVRIRESVDASTLNPISARGELSGYLCMKLFQSLLSIDYKTLEIVPLLAEHRPLIQNLPLGKVKMHYKIREQANWDNGSPITADDVAFSLKILKNPYSSNIGSGSFYEAIEDIQYQSGSKELDIIFSESYILNEIASGDFAILPAHNYDTNHYLSDFTVRELHDPNTAFSPDEILQLSNFDEEFNSADFQRNKNFIHGSGAYELKEWITAQEIILTKKAHWWADGLDSVNTLFENNADKLVYKIISDNSSAILALKNRELDVMRAIPTADFKKLKQDEHFLQYFNLYSPDQSAYQYIGINHNNELLKNKQIRRALRSAIDVDKIINMVSKGYANRIVSPIPLSSAHYNDTLAAFNFNPAKTKEILQSLDWKDSDRNGILDKQINGEMMELEFDYIYNTDSDFRKYIAIILQEDFRKLGIKLHLFPMEWNNYLDRIRNHQFDLYYGARIMSPVPRDHKAAFHTASIAGGGNYVAFSNPTADSLIDQIRTELNNGERILLNWQFQELINEEIPYIFLFAPKERIAISKKYSNVYISSLRPGYWEPAFELKSKE